MIIIPDTHGRDFWREPVAEYLGKEHIIFLGDYLDPYTYEGIKRDVVFPRFESIVEMKKKHPDDVTLLLGNHDLHYVDNNIGGSRYDYANASRNKQFILGNAKCFQLAFTAKAGSKKILFTHAGLKLGWLKKHDDVFPADNAYAAAVTLNIMWSNSQFHEVLFHILADIPYSRWGTSRHGSPVWNDIEDMTTDKEEFPGWYQIFGHSQQESDPVIGENFACLDCRKAFRLMEDGVINELS